MKKILSLLVFTPLLFSLSNSYGQDKGLVFGVKAGFNLANMTYKDDYTSPDIKTRIALHVGGTVDYTIMKNLAIQSGLLFSGKGARYDHLAYKEKIRILYLEVPINAVYTLDVKVVKLLFNAGPYLGVALFGNYKADKSVYGTSGTKDKEAIKFGTASDSNFKRPDFGFNIGASVEWNSLIAGMQYGLGLANIASHTDYGLVARNKVFAITFGYKFGKE